MNLIARNSLSPWSSGFKHKGMTFRPAVLRGPMTPIRLGQAAGAISQATRDQTLAVLNDAFQKAVAIDSWRSENPDWQMAMQADGDEAARLATSVTPMQATAQKVQRVLQSADPASWTVTQQEISDANSWANAMSGIYGLISKHSTTLRPVTVAAPAGTALPVPAAAAKTDYTIPIAIGAGALILGILFFKSRAD